MSNPHPVGHMWPWTTSNTTPQHYYVPLYILGISYILYVTKTILHSMWLRQAKRLDMPALDILKQLSLYFYLSFTVRVYSYVPYNDIYLYNKLPIIDVDCLS